MYRPLVSIERTGPRSRTRVGRKSIGRCANATGHRTADRSISVVATSFFLVWCARIGLGRGMDNMVPRRSSETSLDNTNGTRRNQHRREDPRIPPRYSVARTRCGAAPLAHCSNVLVLCLRRHLLHAQVDQLLY